MDRSLLDYGGGHGGGHPPAALNAIVASPPPPSGNGPASSGRVLSPTAAKPAAPGVASPPQVTSPSRSDAEVTIEVTNGGGGGGGGSVAEPAKHDLIVRYTEQKNKVSSSVLSDAAPDAAGAAANAGGVTQSSEDVSAVSQTPEGRSIYLRLSYWRSE